MDDNLKNSYFRWIYKIFCGEKAASGVSYIRLFKLLFNIDFVVLMESDDNRYDDGLQLRNRFIDLESSYRIDFMSNTPCSILEMMAALAIRCEETIMDDPRYGDRTSQWFWSMMASIGIGYMNDDLFNEEVAMEALTVLNNRAYSPD